MGFEDCRARLWASTPSVPLGDQNVTRLEGGRDADRVRTGNRGRVPVKRAPNSLRRFSIYLERAILKPLPAIFPRAPLVDVPGANSRERPARAALNVISAGIRDFRVPFFIDLPKAAAFASVAGRFGMVLRFVRDDPVGDTRVYAIGLGRFLNIRPNGQPPSRTEDRHGLYAADFFGRRGTPRDVKYSRMGQRRPNDGQDVRAQDRGVKPASGLLRSGLPSPARLFARFGCFARLHFAGAFLSGRLPDSHRAETNAPTAWEGRVARNGRLSITAPTIPQSE